MHNNRKFRHYWLSAKVFIIAAVLNACGTTAEQPASQATLHDWDRSTDTQQSETSYIQPKTDADIRAAYRNYLQHADKNEAGRLAAIQRLAELEFALTETTEDSANDNLDETEPDADAAVRLGYSIELLSTALRDYPDAEQNHIILYRLAKAHDQQSNYNESLQALQQLVEQYPDSPYYAEAQFRLGEAAFARGDYIGAEDAYSSIIISVEAGAASDVLYEKALFKRGWARYKQQLYADAAADYLQVMEQQPVDRAVPQNQDSASATDSEAGQGEFKEYLRAIGLTFAQLGGAEALRDYLQNRPDFNHVYSSYAAVSEIYRQQERYSDAANTLDQFAQDYPQSEYIVQAKLSTIELWQHAGFQKTFHQAIEEFYVNYHPDHDYWQEHNAEQQKAVAVNLKKHVVLLATYHHGRYQAAKKNKAAEFELANRWYQRYFRHYSAHAHQDNAYYLYAELLADVQQLAQALPYYEQAAYDKGLVIDKDAAYACIVITDKLYQTDSAKNPEAATVWLDKHIEYTLLFSQTYPNDPRTETIILHAAELAFLNQQFPKTIELTDNISNTISADTLYTVNKLSARAHFEMGEYELAEAGFLNLLQAKRAKKDREITDNLALAIYQQGKLAEEQGDIVAAGTHYRRIAEHAVDSEIAATGLYDATALYITHELWLEAISAAEQFQALYTKHRLYTDVSKKLSVAYLNSDQSLKAAAAFESISSSNDDGAVRSAALWQAAELYEKKRDYDSAIRSYRQYVDEFAEPYPQYLEAMYKLSQLYTLNDAPKKADNWRRKILKTDKKTYKDKKTERSLWIAATVNMELAKTKHNEFEQHVLVAPLELNLRNKKAAMQSAVALYGQASAYKIAKITSEATYSIANIYNDFSQALLNSERPKELNEQELEQYNILLEDQAFPFEETAIEFHETNLARIKDGVYNDWIAKSHVQLKDLFPARYARETKADVYIRVAQ